MRKIVSRIWVPTLLVMVAALQSFGIDAGRSVGLRRLADSLMLTRQADSSFLTEQPSDSTVPAFADTLVIDSLLTDSLYNDTTAVDSVKIDTLILSAKDISQEHEPPKSRGGKVVGYAHKACNSRKGALTQDEYELWQKLEAIRTGRLKCLENSEKSR